MPLPVFRAALKKQFTNNAHLTDFRVIDRKIAECRQVKHFSFRNLVFSNSFSPISKTISTLNRFQHLLPSYLAGE